MTLVLKNADMAGLLPLDQLVKDMALAFRDLAERQADNAPRVDVASPEDPESGGVVRLSTMQGFVPSLGVAALRFYFSREHWLQAEGTPRIEYSGDYTGLVMLLDAATCRPLAILDDHFQSPLRVAATTAVAADRLARPEASVMALLGSGEQAKAHLIALAAVRDLTEVRVWSPNPEHRAAFADTMATETGIDVRAAVTAEAAVTGADLVTCATNSFGPCFDGAWLSPGAHVALIIVGSTLGRTNPKRGMGEVDRTTYQRSARIVVNNRTDLRNSRQGHLFDLLDEGQLRWEDIHDLGELVTGKAPGRPSPEVITVHGNNRGMGIQFAVSAHLAYREAVRLGRGVELPDELFYTDREGGKWAP